jgi:glycosyltransferase involved in cell wall biosynthesis
MACGKAVILSDTAGLWDREQMRHGEICYLVRPGDPAAMRDLAEVIRRK